MTFNELVHMIAWLAARSDPPHYGKLLLFDFPKGKLVFGPRQIEARIDQDAFISQQITLWSQAGSQVIRGSLLAIPIEESLLYVQPLYLAAERGRLPELKRVITAFGNRIAMEETLETSLQQIFGRRPPGPDAAPKVAAAKAEPSQRLAAQALDHFARAREHFGKGKRSVVPLRGATWTVRYRRRIRGGATESSGGPACLRRARGASHVHDATRSRPSLGREDRTPPDIEGATLR